MAPLSPSVIEEKLDNLLGAVLSSRRTVLRTCAKTRKAQPKKPGLHTALGTGDIQVELRDGISICRTGP